MLVGEPEANSHNESSYLHIFTYLLLEHQPAVCIDTLIDNTRQTDTILLDFLKAFHKASHSRLILKLNHYCIRISP